MPEERIYLDHAATTPLRADVLAAMHPHFSENGYNPSSIHAEGRRAKATLDRARAAVAARLGADPREIAFLGSGSESDNLAILGAARASGRGKHVVSTTVEHHAVLHALDALREEGWDVTLVPVGSDGLLDPDAFERALRDDTALASVMYANNETGVLQPIADLSARARGRGVLFHTDAIQAAPYVPLDVASLGVDLLSISAHKFGGPKGVGALFVRRGVAVVPMVRGGGQEYGLRAGTENVAGIVGLAAAYDLACAERGEAAGMAAALRDRLEEAVLRLGDVRVNGGAVSRAPHISNLSIRNVVTEQLLIRLDLEGVSVSGGSACTSGVLAPSHVLAAMHLPQEWLTGVVRFSVGHGSTAGQIERAIAIVSGAIQGLRAISAVPA